MLNIRDIDIADVNEFIIGERSLIQCKDMNRHESSMLSSIPSNEIGFKYVGGFDGEDMIGFMVVKPDSSYLCRMYVSRENRRKGFAKSMIESEDIKGLMCFTDNEPGLRLYRGLGFKSVGDTPSIVEIMEK